MSASRAPATTVLTVVSICLRLVICAGGPHDECQIATPQDAMACCTTIAHNMMRHETLFNGIIAELFWYGYVPEGDVVDAGAHTGENTCLYAKLAPTRKVLAVEPVEANVLAIKGRGLANVDVMQAGLAHRSGNVLLEATDVHNTTGAQVEFTFNLVSWERDRKLKAHSKHDAKHDAKASRAASSDKIRLAVHSIDNLYATQRLGFAHFDVEGEELNVLRGALATIRRDRPIFTAELHVHFSHRQTLDLLRFGEELGYHNFLVEGDAGGTCGVRLDCRNIISVPREHTGTVAALEPYTKLQKLLPINGSNIFKFAHPCCAPGAVCCRKGPVPIHLSWTAENHGYSCCLPKVIEPIYARNLAVRYSVERALGSRPVGW